MALKEKSTGFSKQRFQPAMIPLIAAGSIGPSSA
jgi:hypothetical protein